MLYKGKYYLYHGAGPALLLFAPWRLITGFDLPENFGLFLLCSGAFLFAAGTLFSLLALANVSAGPLLRTFMLLALGVGQSVPYVFNRVMMYELAITGAYFCTSAAWFFLVRSWRSKRPAAFLAAAGLMFGMAIACRPHMIFGGIITLLLVLFTHAAARPRLIAPFAATFLSAGLAIAAYNYARFADPFEFGTRYQLTGDVTQQRINIAASHLEPGAYYMLLCPPSFRTVFPWVHTAYRLPFGRSEYPFPKDYFYEPLVGILWSSPLVLLALFIPRGPTRPLQIAMLLSAMSAMLFVILTGLTTQRYQIDFLPLLTLVAIANAGILISRGHWRIPLTLAFLVLAVYTVFIHLALSITGPSDDFLRNRPRSWTRLAGWFSAGPHLRPLHDPEVAIELDVDFSQIPQNRREPILTMGHQAHSYMLYAEYLTPESIRLTSQSGDATEAKELARPSGPAGIRIECSPKTGTSRVDVNGTTLITHPLTKLVTAPAQITPGENQADPGMSARRANIPIKVRELKITPSNL